MTGTGRPPATVALVACALVLAPTLAFRIGVDQGVFAYMGGALLEGAWPYLHTWESDFPGLIILQAVEILVLGKSIAAFRLFDLLFQLGNAFLIYRITSRIHDGAAGLVAAVLFCLIYQGYGPWNTAQREGFALLFVLMGFWMYFTAERRSALVTAAAIGLGLGIAAVIKPTLLALALFYAPLLTKLRSQRALTLVSAAGAGLVAPAAVIVAGYWAADGLVELYEACVAYQTIYTARLRGQDPLLVYWLQKLTRFGTNALLLPVAYLPFLFRTRWRRERIMLWLGYTGSLYAIFVQGTFAGYHYLPGLAIGAVLVGSLYSFAANSLLSSRDVSVAAWREPVQHVVAWVLLAGAALFYMRNAPFSRLMTLQFLKPPEANEFRNQTVFDFTESYDVAAYLRERTQPDERIQVWGYESLVYYLANRRAASRFQMTHPLVMRVPGKDLTPMQIRWRAEFLGDVTLRPPTYIAVVRQDNWWWAPEEQTSEQLLDDFPEWKRIIERDYTLEHTIGRFLIYRRTNAPGTPVLEQAGDAP